MYRSIVLGLWIFVMNLSANPISLNLLSEAQVTTPTKWAIELDYNHIIGPVFSQDASIFDTVLFQSNRYNDSFYIGVSFNS